MIYLDNAATTKISPEVAQTVDKISKDNYANPGSSHSPGTKARNVLENSRNLIAKYFNCQPKELIFNSGGSESNNLAIKGLVKTLDRSDINDKEPIEIVTSKIEHKSVLNTVADLKKNFSVAINYIEVDKTGQINLDSLRKKITSRTRFVSVIYANNETGVIQPVEKIVDIISKINQDRSKDNRIYLHLDAVQAVEYQTIDLSELKIDLLSLSAHKFHGPKGVGLLYSRKDVPLMPIISGGGQENNLRSGTENLPIEQISMEDKKKVEKLRDLLEKKISQNIKDIQINGRETKRTPHISSISFKQAEGESIMLALDLEGISVSTGSACNAKDLKASHVLRAMGLRPEQAQSTVRFSFSRFNNKNEVNQLVKSLKKIIPKLRKISAKVH